MRRRVKTTEELLELFAGLATAPPPENLALLVRHLQCKTSIRLTRAVTEAIPRYAERNAQLLRVPTCLLPPLA